MDFAGRVNTTIRATRLPGVLKNDDTSLSQNVPSNARVVAGAFGFLILIQVFDGPLQRICRLLTQSVPHLSLYEASRR